MAKTLDRWMHDAQYYQAGADLVIRVYKLPVASNPFTSGAPAQPTPQDITQGAQSLVDLQALLKVGGIRSATNVGKYNALVVSNAGATASSCGDHLSSFPRHGLF